MKLETLLLICYLPSTLAFWGIGRKQSVAASGRLFCNGLPAVGIRVKLYESEILWDRKMDETRTSFDGSFIVSGNKREITTIDPTLYIYHRCNYDGPCLKKASIDIPRQFVFDGPVPPRRAELGPISLNGPFPDQSTDCIN